MLRAFIIVLLSLPFLMDSAMAEGVISGRAIVVDGDTLEIAGERIRLSGIDAPELDQTCADRDARAVPCGRIARDRLRDKIGDAALRCEIEGRDRYKRILARCRLGTLDLQSWLVREGLAVSFVRYSRDYDADEAAARGAGAGMWAGRFMMPWDWRRGS